MSLSFTLLSLNIEQRKHLDRVFPYMLEKRPDIICLQEVFEDTFKDLKTQLGYEGVFVKRAEYLDMPGDEGIAILTHGNIRHYSATYYDAFTEPHPELTHVLKIRPKAGLLTTAIEFSDQIVNIGTTHFTWSDKGEVTDQQRVNMQRLIILAKQQPELVLCGDFNTARGKELYDQLASQLKDNIPADITSTIDPNLHKAGKLEYVVDSLFTTPQYTVETISIESGLSDHCGILATVRR